MPLPEVRELQRQDSRLDPAADAKRCKRKARHLLESGRQFLLSCNATLAARSGSRNPRHAEPAAPAVSAA